MAKKELAKKPTVVRVTTKEDKIKHLVSSILGQQGVSVVKKIIKR